MVAAATGIRLVTMPEPSAISILAIKAIADPQALPRVCGLLAQFGVIPMALTCRQVGVLLIIDVQFESSTCEKEELLLAKIQELVQVRRASVVTGG